MTPFPFPKFIASVEPRRGDTRITLTACGGEAVLTVTREWLRDVPFPWRYIADHIERAVLTDGLVCVLHEDCRSVATDSESDAATRRMHASDCWRSRVTPDERKRIACALFAQAIGYAR